MRFLSATLLLIVATLTWADQTIFSQQYKTRIEGIPITTTRSLVELNDGTFEFRIRSANFLARFEEVSHFEKLQDGSIRPLYNLSERKVFGISSKSSTTFDWQTLTATYRHDDVNLQTELVAGMMDRTLYQYQLERDMRSGNPNLSYEVVDRGRIRNFTFENLGVETLVVGSQELSAFRLRRITETDERETLVWIAADLNYEIVKIYHREKDDSEYEMSRLF